MFWVDDIPTPLPLSEVGKFIIWGDERERVEKIQVQKIEWQKIERQKNISGGKREKIAHFISDDTSEFLR